MMRLAQTILLCLIWGMFTGLVSFVLAHFFGVHVQCAWLFVSLLLSLFVGWHIEKVRRFLFPESPR